MTRKLFIIASLALSLCSTLLSTGCQSIGSRVNQNAKGVGIEAGSPNTLAMTDADGQWVTNGIGPQRFTDIDSEGNIQTFQQGTTPRDLTWTNPSGAKLAISSGTDIKAGSAEFYDPVTGNLVAKVSDFGTVSSEPLRAGNEAYDRLVGYWQSLTQAQRDAAIAEIETTGQVTESMVPLVLQFLSGL